MSTLRVSTIQDTAGSNSSTPAAIANGIAKAWVNFNGTGVVAIRAQYNVSSITDGGTGNYTVNFTSAMTDGNFSTVVGISQGSSQGLVHAIGQGGPNLNSANFANNPSGSVKIVTGNPSSSVVFDVDSVNVSVFR